MATTPSLGPLTRRIIALEQLVADLNAKRAAGLPLTAPTPMPASYAPNIVAPNDRFQLGDTGWLEVDYDGSGGGTLSVETAAPLDGTASGRIDEAASSTSRIAWLPTGNVGAPVVGADVFNTVPGDVWTLSALTSCSVNRPHAQIYALAGATAPDCYFGLFSARSVLIADDQPLTAGVPVLMQGNVTIPADRSYVTFAVSAEPLGTGGAPAVAWSWLFDVVSMARLRT